MEIIETIEKQRDALREALQHLLEVQVKPSSEYCDEWREAVRDAKIVIRRCKTNPIP